MSEPNSRALQNLQNAIDDTSLWLVFALMGGAGASMLALGMLLRSNQALTWRVVLGSVLHSLAWGFAVFLMAYKKLDGELPLLLGLSIFSGLGTASFIDLVLLLVKQRLGISVTINPPASADLSKEP
ncbi:hypothetical protein [Paucibacter sp. Y2R2-4]|uniref:hypothetical protein n=1 Tax=Paucibacter sp. Y2R2-4 TaxID=2893553 RepID=UPI0021E361D8|nr:hypothetical protein [Paucibacter sp. Y2R2-4]MCV2349342.1 hypothetical protein [Paucibacter sp. Y2R2-4]